MLRYEAVKKLDIDPSTVKSYSHKIDRDFDIISIKIKDNSKFFSKKKEWKFKRVLSKYDINDNKNYSYSNQTTYVSNYTMELIQSLDNILRDKKNKTL